MVEILYFSEAIKKGGKGNTNRKKERGGGINVKG